MMNRKGLYDLYLSMLKGKYKENFSNVKYKTFKDYGYIIFRAKKRQYNLTVFYSYSSYDLTSLPYGEFKRTGSTRDLNITQLSKLLYLN